MTEIIPAPYPEIDQQQQEQSVREQYQAIVAREAKEAEAAHQARLGQINATGQIEELLTDMRLRNEFVAKFGYQRYGALHLAHVRNSRQQKQDADRAAKMGRRQISTTAGRLAASEAARRVAGQN